MNEMLLGIESGGSKQLLNLLMDEILVEPKHATLKGQHCALEKHTAREALKM